MFWNYYNQKLKESWLIKEGTRNEEKETICNSDLRNWVFQFNLHPFKVLIFNLKIGKRFIQKESQKEIKDKYKIHWGRILWNGTRRYQSKWDDCNSSNNSWIALNWRGK